MMLVKSFTVSGQKLEAILSEKRLAIVENRYGGLTRNYNCYFPHPLIKNIQWISNPLGLSYSCSMPTTDCINYITWAFNSPKSTSKTKTMSKSMNDIFR